MDLRDEEESAISGTAGGDQILTVKETITSRGQKKESCGERKKILKKNNLRAARQPWWSRWFRRSRPRLLSTQ